jgi:hypothetical protein
MITRCFLIDYTGLPPLMTRRRIATIAITRRIWITLPTLYAKNPKAQIMIKMTAMT